MTEISLILATIALTYALTDSEGPWGIFAYMRKRSARFGLLQCFTCTSFWASLALVWAFKPELGVLGWLAIWGACVVFDKILSAYITRG